MANRTLQFYGYAYGSTPVQLNAHINGQVVFSGPVSTIDTPIPPPPSDMTSAPVLFSVENSALVPTEFSGSLPMTVSVATGTGVVLGEIYCNYMPTGNVVVTDEVTMENSSISGTTLTVGSVTSGTITIGQSIADDAGTIVDGTVITAGSGSTWTVNISQTVASTTIQGGIEIPVPGDAATFVDCFDGIPANSEGTPDSRSSVAIDGVTQVPPAPASEGQWTWIVPQGSTIACNLNISQGSA
jgi:hypothetical protein